MPIKGKTTLLNARLLGSVIYVCVTHDACFVSFVLLLHSTWLAQEPHYSWPTRDGKRTRSGRIFLDPLLIRSIQCLPSGYSGPIIYKLSLLFLLAPFRLSCGFATYLGNKFASLGQLLLDNIIDIFDSILHTGTVCKHCDRPAAAKGKVYLPLFGVA